MTLKALILRLANQIPIVKDAISKREQEIIDLRMALVKHCYPELHKEADYILEHGRCMYPYKRLYSLPYIEFGYDKGYGLPYVIHKGKRLYFPKSYSVKRCVKSYRSLTENDCILGGNYLEKQPHQYQSDTFKIEKGDIFADVGCAEGLLALDTIDLVEKVYLLEGDPKWIPALQATFHDYRDKAIIINKYVADDDSVMTIRLQSALKDSFGKALFIKMDIEGAEIDVLRGCKDYIASISNVKLACCTYHHQSDAENIVEIYEEMGFKYEFSEGFMYFKAYDKEHYFPYFRHGVIRGWK